MRTIEKALVKLRNEKEGVGGESRHSNSAQSEKENSATRIKLPWDLMAEKGMLTPKNGRSEIAEELRAIKRPILKKAFSSDVTQENHNNLVMITSSVPSEGKSFNAINLAISIAMELDRTALLVDADVAKPSLAKYLDFQAEKGLVDFLVDDDISLSDVLLKTDLPKLSILPAGKQHHYSTELLASERMKILLDELSTRYHDRVVIFDSPPVLATSESHVLASQMGQVIMVVEAVKTSQSVLEESLSVIQNSNITGLILNKSRVKSGGSSYGYGYGYGQEKED